MVYKNESKTQMNYFSKKPLKSTGFFKPFNGDSYALKSTGCGVYVIKHNGTVVYVGLSRKDLQNTLYRHFQLWNDRRAGWTKKNEPYERVSYYGKSRDNFLIKVIFCKTANEAEILEQLLIKKFKPKDNSLKVYLYSQDEYNKMAVKITEAEGWKSNNDEPPF